MFAPTHYVTKPNLIALLLELYILLKNIEKHASEELN